MAQAKSGDTVRVHYTGTLEDDTVFDSSRERDPLEFSLGSGMVVPGFENLVLGLQEGETAKETIPCAEAYGERREDLQVQRGGRRTHRRHGQAGCQPSLVGQGPDLRGGTGRADPRLGVRAAVPANQSDREQGSAQQRHA